MKKILGIVLALCLCMSNVLSLPSALAEADSEINSGDRLVKYFLQDRFAIVQEREGSPVVSGWDVNAAGGQISGGGLQITDTSNVLPVEASRMLEPITYGKVTVDIPVYFGSLIPGTTIALKNGGDPILEYYFSEEHICVSRGNWYQPITPYWAGMKFCIRAELDFDAKQISNIYINGTRLLWDVPFASDAPQADRVWIQTGKEAAGSMIIDKVFISRGYTVNEEFDMNWENVPPDWTLAIDGNIVGAEQAKTSGTYFKGDHVILRNGQQETVLSKTVPGVTGKNVFEFQLMEPVRRVGAKVSLKNDGEDVFTIVTDRTGFAYTRADGGTEHFYDCRENLWYHFRVEVDSQTKKANLYMNERLMVAGIVLNASAGEISCVEAKVDGSGSGDIFFSGVKLYPKEEFADYVPEPVKPQKDEDFELGMQMCPLWSENWHLGWDYINAAEGRHPLLGFYDEGDPEAADWQIKWMVENGIDFQWYCWYAMGNRDTHMSPALNGIRRAKYNDKIKFAIMFENASLDILTGTQEENAQTFLNTIAPFWIEHYFKHPSYYKVSGRPLVGMYHFWTAESRFGTQGFREVLTAFRQMCVEAGVGNPYFIQQYGTGPNVQTISNWGVDAMYCYNFGAAWPETQVSENYKAYDNIKNLGSMQWIPSISPGFDVYAWGGDMGVALNILKKEEFTPTGFPTPQ